jgi:hypothetical protein
MTAVKPNEMVCFVPFENATVISKCAISHAWILAGHMSSCQNWVTSKSEQAAERPV